MKTKTKRIWRTLALLVVFAVVAGLLWKTSGPPQIITLPNGEQYQFVAAEWGTNYVQPTGLARFASHLPPPIASYVYRKWGGRLGIATPIGLPYSFLWSPVPYPPPKPALHLWFRSLSTNTIDTFGAKEKFKFMLADQNGMAAGQGISGGGSYGQGTDKWLVFDFRVLPRRSEMLHLLLFKADDQLRGPYTQTGATHFRNPLYGHFPDWQPETLPVTKTNGDLTVQLTDFSIGSGNQGGNQVLELAGRQTRFHPPGAGEDQEIVFKLDIHSPRGTNEDWSFQPAELSDATGNRVSASHLGRWSITDEYHMRPALWPDESAWRLKLTLRRFRGHDPEEIVTFTNVPVPAVGATNVTFQTNLIHGVPVVVKQQFVRNPDQAQPIYGRPLSTSYVVGELVESPEGFVVDYEQMKTDTDWIPREWSSIQTTNSATISLSTIPADVRTLDITWVVQKTRTVEFLVRPPQSKQQPH